uniref:Uncharacterized protein n=1 Tax=Brassica oleracea TaxID=3712 RepID=A0A3P6EEJ2_BRAOL|nr:unnamed protein product [Brassica oleracea]
MVSPRATATAVYTQSLGELVPSLHGFRDFILFGVKTGKKKSEKAIRRYWCRR